MRKAKKALITVAATVALSSAIAAPASAAQHEVRSGDTLWSISQAYGTSVSSLRSINGISGSLIYPGQVIETSTSRAAAPAPAQESTSAVHKVVWGDTLYKIGRSYGVSVSELMSLNGLNSHMIYAGQTLKVGGSAPEARTAAAPAPAVKSVSSSSAYSAVADIAKQYIGVPYVWGGSTPSGFDCSGFIYYSLKKAGVNVSRTNAAGFYNMADKVSSPQPGDLVFFSGTYKAGISHVGIYIGGGKMVSAAGSSVQIDSVYGPYWGDRFTGFGRM
ncbi:LysM peptidoglycan-binding domain-containing protein [Indiicoccus explosivorum]|uniref:LysM peptidoglycan-binding domain-containing protein n=1 Tax=Indiicoccus explosivorum TaxID=1917864 RepID=UPI00138FC22F|nr:LysM peptidoglycan-binding domain-containing protein [Indiicoccus explosivorum]